MVVCIRHSNLGKHVFDANVSLVQKLFEKGTLRNDEGTAEVVHDNPMPMLVTCDDILVHHVGQQSVVLFESVNHECGVVHHAKGLIFKVFGMSVLTIPSFHCFEQRHVHTGVHQLKIGNVVNTQMVRNQGNDLV